MKKITEITPAICKELRNAISAFAADEAKARGLTIRCSGGTYSKEKFGFKVTFSVEDTSTMEEKFEKDFRRRAFGAEELGWLGKDFAIRGRKFTLLGSDSRARKKPYIGLGKNPEGLYKFSFEELLDAFAPVDTVQVTIAKHLSR